MFNDSISGMTAIEVTPGQDIHEITNGEYESGLFLLFKRGVHIIKNTILLPSHSIIIGEGELGETILMLDDGASCHFFSNRDQSAGNTNIKAENITLNGNMHKQEKPQGSGVAYACGFYLKRVSNIMMKNIVAKNIRQTAVHFNFCHDIHIHNLVADTLGWSGLSTSEASNLHATGKITNSGLDVIHSAIHIDGGAGIYLDFNITGSNGNGFMIDSTFNPAGLVIINGSAVQCKRGVSLSGSATNEIRNVYIKGNFSNNRDAGVMISNAHSVSLIDSDIHANGEVGILLQGRYGGNGCIVAGNRLSGNPTDIEERHESKFNLIRHYPHNSVKLVSKLQTRRRNHGKQYGLLYSYPLSTLEDPTVQANSQRFSTCSCCGELSTFLPEKNQPIRESCKCSECGASLRHRAQAEAVLSVYGRGRSRSIKDLCQQGYFNSLDIYEPGIIGPNRKYMSALPAYTQSYFWEDLPLGEQRGGVRNEDLTNLTFEDGRFDLIITSDIFEHIRRPYEGFAEIARVLKPGGHHIFTIPVLRPMASKTVFRVDTTSEEDVHVLEPRYHIAGDGSSCLVYTDFGSDMLEKLGTMGMPTQVLGAGSGPEASRVVTFVSRKV